MLAVSDDFHAAEEADVNKLAAEVYLVLGNYATPGFGSSASASGAAANYPASGAIDGDRTELNVGAASGADNDVGQSSWRSTVAPDTTPQTLTVDMAQSRTINRIKLYHLSSHGLSSFKLESSPNNTDWTLIAKTTDQGGTISTTHEVDTIDFTDVACRYVKLTISGTVVALDTANVTEIEIYRLLDITDRVISMKTDRARDYQLSDSLAATAQIVLSNADKFFSPSYSPTAAEITDGFVNSELNPGLGIIVKQGFDFIGSQEVAQTFIGTIDKIAVKPTARTATFECRDNVKNILNKIVSTKLKTSQDIGALILYMLNKGNISTWETDIDTSTITLDYFFTFDEAILTTIRSLVEAAGDAQFYFDENGTAIFRMYLNSVPQEEIITDEADWNLGTFTNVESSSDPGTIRRQWYRIDDFADNDLTSNPAWSKISGNTAGAFSPPTGTGTWSASSGELIYASDAIYSHGRAATPFTRAVGTWETQMKFPFADIGSLRFYFMASGIWSTFLPLQDIVGGYFVEVTRAAGQFTLSLKRSDSAGGGAAPTITTLQNATAGSPDDAYHKVRVTRTSAGAMNVYWDGVLKMTHTDNTYTSSSYVAYKAIPDSGHSPISDIQFYIDSIFYSFAIEASSIASTDQPVYVSGTIDQSAAILSEGVFGAHYIEPANTSITFYTATSADGISWDPYVLAIPGDQIGSTARRYIRFKVVKTTLQDSGTNVNLDTPYVQDVTINYFTGTGSTKYPSSVSFFFDGDLNIDLEQVYADSIAGDSAIINSIAVKAQPLVLSGSDTDVQWQGTTATPPADISAGNPLAVTNGQTLTYPIVVESGMDTSRMSGANPAAAAITFAGGGAGSWVFSSIHPTRPILVITISGTGTITNLQVQGKAFSNDNTFLEKTASDTDSIQKFDERKTTLSNRWIVSSAMAQNIATRLVQNYAAPTSYVNQIKVRPTPSVQIGDRVTVEDENLSIEEDYLVIGVSQKISASLQGMDADTTLKLLQI